MTININQNAIQNILIVQEHETSRTSYKLFKEIGSSSLVEDHRLFRFKIEGRDTILHGDPRFVGGNLLVMEFWEPDFTHTRTDIVGVDAPLESFDRALVSSKVRGHYGGSSR